MEAAKFEPRYVHIARRVRPAADAMNYRNPGASYIPPMQRTLLAVVCLFVTTSCIFVRAHAAPRPRVEIQINLCGEPGTIESALNLRALGRPIQEWLFDTPSLTLFARGVRIRLRVSGTTSELTVKVANQDCAHLAARIPSKDGKCEYDLHGETRASAVSLSRHLDAAHTRAILAGDKTVTDVLSTMQTSYLRDVVGVWPLPVNLHGLGPIAVRRYRTAHETHEVDISQLPDATRYVEISQKVPLPNEANARAKLEADLARAGVAQCADQSAQAVHKLHKLLAASPE